MKAIFREGDWVRVENGQTVVSGLLMRPFKSAALGVACGSLDFIKIANPEGALYPWWKLLNHRPVDPDWVISL